MKLLRIGHAPFSNGFGWISPHVFDTRQFLAAVRGKPAEVAGMFWLRIVHVLSGHGTP